MGFQTPITIKEVVDNIYDKKYLLPAIQREVVWDSSQIERLFDSLMRDYPIGSFLFWKVQKENVGDYQFYDFVRNFHERDMVHNPKADVNSDNDIVGILDGQQRFTSLYIALRGSYAYKEPHKRWNNSNAFPKRYLFLNLLAPKENGDQTDLFYDFSFLTKEEAESCKENQFWFKVGEILNFKKEWEINDYLIKQGVMDKSKEFKEFANHTLFQLFSVVHRAQSINYYLEKDESLDKVLNIFIRVNSGGTILSYSDLLLSIASAQWKDKSARDEITSFVDEINGIGSGFKFDKDFVLKSSLVLSDFNNIAFKVDNFKKDKMLKIEQEWDEIKRAIREAVNLFASFGYSRDTLTANYAVIPVAYYLRKNNFPNNFHISEKYKEERNKIKYWISCAIIKRIFGGAPDAVLRPLREVLRNNNSGFPLNEITDKFKGTNRTIIFTEDDIDNLLQYKYGQSYTYSILTYLYPFLDYKNKFHIDHIHPKSYFTKSKLVKMGVSLDLVEFYIDNVNLIGNLQLLEGELNLEKRDTEFSKWLKNTNSSEDEIKYYNQKNYIPECDLDILNFKEFIEKRNIKLKSFMLKHLNVKSTENDCIQ